VTRLPNPGGDDNQWGDILNAFLEIAHNGDGSLKGSAISSAGGELTANKGSANGYAPLNGSSKVSTTNLPVGTTSGTVAAGDDSRITGALQSGSSAGGDLSGTLPNPTVAKLNGVSVSNTPSSANQILTATGTTAASWQAPAASTTSTQIPSWTANTAYTTNTQVLAPTGDLVTPVANFTSGSTYDPSNWKVLIPVSNYATDRLWRASNIIAVPSSFNTIGAGTATLVSGQAYLVGGPGCVIPTGRTANYISFLSNGAAVSPTHTWFFLAIPDASTSTATVVATTKDNLTTAWGGNTVITLSLKTTDGGSGSYTPTTDTPVYIGIVHVASTPASIRGISGSGAVGGMLSPRMWWGSGPTGLTTPSSIAGNVAVGAVSAIPMACYVSES
jgi:hypothetical protein